MMSAGAGSYQREADVTVWADDANNAVTSEARLNAANALFAARADFRCCDMYTPVRLLKNACVQVKNPRIPGIVPNQTRLLYYLDPKYMQHIDHAP